jgi:hypothetical protein
MLKDVQAIRPFAVLLIVIGHAFIIYRGDVPSWPPPPNFEPNLVYNWIYHFASSIHLQAFVFIAGYVYSFQQITKKKAEKLTEFTSKKFSRLIIPSIIFSIVYYYMFLENEVNVWYISIYNIINGTGHMWFLPMLFWVYIFGWILTKYSEVRIKLLMALGFISILSVVLPDILRISSAISYLYYFMLGYFVYKNQKIILQYQSKKVIFILTVGFIVIFVCYQLAYPQLKSVATNGLIQKISYILSGRLIQTTYGTIGLIALYSWTNYLVSKTGDVSRHIVTANAYCYGVYFFQQFILKFLYYKTNIPMLLGPILLPLFALVVTLLASFILTHILLKFKVGRFLVG